VQSFKPDVHQLEKEKDEIYAQSSANFETNCFIDDFNDHRYGNGRRQFSKLPFPKYEQPNK